MAYFRELCQGFRHIASGLLLFFIIVKYFYNLCLVLTFFYHYLFPKRSEKTSVDVIYLVIFYITYFSCNW